MRFKSKLISLALSSSLALGIGLVLSKVAHPVLAEAGSSTLVSKNDSKHYQEGFLTPTGGGTSATWDYDAFTVVQSKNSSTNNVALTYDEIRVYAKHSLTITPKTGYQINTAVATCASNSYGTALNNGAFTNATSSISNAVVTITPESSSIAFDVTVTAQSRINTLVITYSSASSDPDIILDKTSVNLYIGESETLVATDINLTGEVAWESSNINVCTVENGVVTGVGAGEATVRAYDSGDDSVYAECAVTVLEGPVYEMDLGYSAENTTRFVKTEGAVDEVLTATAELGNAGLLWTATVTPMSGQKASISDNNFADNGSNQFGKSNYFVSSVVIRSNIYSTVSYNSFNKVLIMAGGSAGGSDGTISVSVGGVDLTCEDNTFEANTTKQFIFASETPVMGHVEIRLTNNITTTSVNSGMKLVSVQFIEGSKNTTSAGLANDFASEVEKADGCINNSGLVAKYKALDPAVKSLADLIVIYDHESGDALRENARTASYTVLEKMMQLISFEGGASSKHLTLSNSNNVVVLITISLIIAFTSISVFLVIKKKRYSK